MSPDLTDPSFGICPEVPNTSHLKKMYQGLGSWISFENLNWLSNLLGTEKINIRNEHYRRGCDSCDWGSEHNADIICQEITII